MWAVACHVRKMWQKLRGIKRHSSLKCILQALKQSTEIRLELFSPTEQLLNTRSCGMVTIGPTKETTDFLKGQSAC